MIVKVQGNGHANLDSFPFRYGFTYNTTERLELTSVRNKSEVVDNRYHIDASFKNPETNKTEKGHFVLLNDNESTVVTVWGFGMDNKDETRLSETLRSARVRGKITTNDMMVMHSQKIRSLDEFIDYLADKLSDTEVALINEDANKKVENLSKALSKLHQEKQSLQSDIDKKESEVNEYKKIIAELKSATNNAYDNRNSGGVWNPGVYTVISVSRGNKGRNNQKAIFVRLRDKSGFEFEVANNWARGLEDRYRQAKILIGETIKYSTLGSFGRDWFMNISTDISESDLSNRPKTVMRQVQTNSPGYYIEDVQVVSGSEFNSNWRGNMQKVTTNKGIYIDNITNPENQMLTPGFDWSSIIGTTVYDAVINHSRGCDWINKR